MSPKYIKNNMNSKYYMVNIHLWFSRNVTPQTVFPIKMLQETLKAYI